VVTRTGSPFTGTGNCPNCTGNGITRTGSPANGTGSRIHRTVYRFTRTGSGITRAGKTIFCAGLLTKTLLPNQFYNNY
jgi:hypothetical protein